MKMEELARERKEEMEEMVKSLENMKDQILNLDSTVQQKTIEVSQRFDF